MEVIMEMDKMKLIGVDEFVDSPFQPRREYHGLEDLAESMRGSGVLQSLLCREVDGRYELVAGHRRVRAARMANIAQVPAIVRALTDQEVREAILVENGQREDLTPLEELEIYERMREAGFEVADIASRIGKPEGHVYRRLQLARLCNIGRARLASGALRVSVAELIARVDDLLIQEKAVDELSEDEYRSRATLGVAKSWMERNAVRKLKLATFDTEDAEQFGGACSACPKNSAGAQLFPDLEGATCYDPACWSTKTEAAWRARAEAAQARGVTVLEGEEADAVFANYGALKPGWVSLDEHVWTGEKNKKLASQLGKSRMKDLEVYLVRDRSGREMEIVKRGEIKKRMREAPKPGDPPVFSGAKGARELEEERAKKVKARFRELVLEALAVHLERVPMQGTFETWQMLALGMVGRSWADTLSSAERRRKIAVKDDGAPEEFAADWLVSWIEGRRDAHIPHSGNTRREHATAPDLQVLVLEMMLAPEFAAGDLRKSQSPFAKRLIGSLVGDLDPLWTDAERAVDVKSAPKEPKEPKRKAKKDPVDPEPTPETAPPSDADVLKEILTLHEEGKNYREIAELTGLSKDQVARRIKKASA